MVIESAPAIGGIAKRTEQQWNVIVLRDVLDMKGYIHKRIEGRHAPQREVAVHVKSEPVIPFDQRAGEKFGDSAVFIGDTARDILPRTGRGFEFQQYADVRRRAADRSIQDVGADSAHPRNILSRRSVVIFCCSSAAICNSY